MIVQRDLELELSLGAKRQAAHIGNSTARFFADNSEENVRGVAGELAFAKQFGLEIDASQRPGGDGAIDFTVEIRGRRLTIDVKTARSPIFLLVKDHDIARCADILVLARADGLEIEFLGWEHKSIMQIMPTREFGFGIRSYYRHYSLMRPMWQLRELLDCAGTSAHD